MRRPLLAALLAIGCESAAAEPPPDAPDLEFLEFLGEMGEADPDLIAFLESRMAEEASKDAASAEPKEDDDE
jgi:hypothetical protein